MLIGIGISASIPPAIDGDPEPVPGYDVVLLLGQSNIVGYTTAEADPEIDTPDPRVKQWPMRGPSTGSVIEANEPLWYNDLEVLPFQDNGVGPGLAFGKLLVPGLAPGRTVLLVPAAHGATTLVFGTPARWAPGMFTDQGTYIGQGDLFSATMTAITSIMALEGTNRLTCMIWGQGEGDGTSPGVTEDMYRKTLCDAFNTIRYHWDANYSDGTHPVFVINDMLPLTIENLPDEMLPILSAQHDVEDKLPYVGFAPGTDGYDDPAGGGHYSALGNRTVRPQAFFDAMPSAAANTAPDLATPSAPTGLAELATAPTTIDLEWDDMANTTSYLVEIKLASEGDGSYEGYESPTRVFRFTLLEPGTAYDIRVTGRNATQESAPCASVEVSTLAIVEEWARYSAYGGTDVTLDGDNVTNITDSSGNGRDAVHPSTVEFDPDNLPITLITNVTSWDNKFATAGTREMVETPYPVGSHTMMLMFKRENTPGEVALLCGGIASVAFPTYWSFWNSEVKGYYIQISDDGSSYVVVDGQNDFPTVGGGAVLVPADTWVCLAVSFDDTDQTAKLYLNGVEVDSSTGVYNGPMEQNRFWIGMSAVGWGHQPFQWSECVLWGEAITAGQVAYETQLMRAKWHEDLAPL